jgi:hypothetical protein
VLRSGLQLALLRKQLHRYVHLQRHLCVHLQEEQHRRNRPHQPSDI